MKKFIYILLIAATSSFVFTACTDEVEVKPSYEAGGGTGDDKI